MKKFHKIKKTVLAGEIVCGIGVSLISGSDSAFIHATLRSLGRENEFKKIEGTATALKLAAGFFTGSLIGGLVASYSLRLTMFGSAAITFFAFLITLFFREPPLPEPAAGRQTLLQLAAGSVKIVREHRLVLWLFFYYSFAVGLAHQFVWYYQPYFALLNIPVIHFGWLYALLGAGSVLSSKFTQEIENFFGNRGVLLFLSFTIIAASFALGMIVSLYAISFFLLHQIFAGTAKTIFSDRMLKIIPPDKAATILSINNLGFRLVYSAVGPVYGYITDHWGLQTMFLWIGLTASAVTIVLFIAYRFIPEHFHEDGAPG